MRHCDLHTGRIRLTRGAKKLREQWNETKDYWNDANRLEFDEAFLQPLGPQITLMLSAIQQLTEVLDQAERACSDEDE